VKKPVSNATCSATPRTGATPRTSALPGAFAVCSRFHLFCFFCHLHKRPLPVPPPPHSLFTTCTRPPPAISRFACECVSFLSGVSRARSLYHLVFLLSLTFDSLLHFPAPNKKSKTIMNRRQQEHGTCDEIDMAQPSICMKMGHGGAAHVDSP
jgi:hypothetical protein